MQGEFWPSTGPTSPDGETCGRFYPTPRASDADRGGRGELLHVAKGDPSPRGSLRGESTSSRPASRARTSATPGEAQGWPESDPGCGSKPPASFARFDPDTCSWRTSQRSLLGGWTPFSGRWTRSGMTRNGTAYRLPTLAPRISGTGSSFWGTPTSHERTHSPRPVDHGMQLANQAASPAMWPTPRVSGSNRTSRSALLNIKAHPSGRAGLSLEQAVEVKAGLLPKELDSPDQLPPLHRATWPTPTAHGNNNRAGLSPKSGDGLGTAARRAASPSSEGESEAIGRPTPPTTLNPEWVEWLMGVPRGWTEV